VHFFATPKRSVVCAPEIRPSRLKLSAALAAEVVVEALLPRLEVGLLVFLAGLADRALAAERVGRDGVAA